MKLRGECIQNWNRISVDLIQPQDLDDLKKEVFSTLKEPFLPVPSLRREANFFPTILQDLIGNAFTTPSDFEMPFGFPALEVFKNCIDQLEMNFMDSEQIQNLSYKRWLLKKPKKDLVNPARNSLASQSTCEESERNPNILLCLMTIIKKTVKVHCRAVCAYLRTLPEALSFLSGYNMLVVFI